MPFDPTAWQHMTRTLAHYERYEQIGEGTYGQVYRARCRDTQQIVALKKMRLHHGGYWGMPLQLIREIKILKRLSHPNLLRMVEVVTSKGVEHLDADEPTSTSPSDQREAYKGNLFLVLEYVQHDLTGLMDVAYQFTPVQVKCIFKQLLEALQYMHEQRYVHRDIKSSNILLGANFRLKLADFGLARCIEPPLLDQNPQDQLTNKVITLWYRPPEILVGATDYGAGVDIWSAGCILAELLIGKPLFTGKTELEQLHLIWDMLGNPTMETWDYLKTKKKAKSGEITIDMSRPKKNRLREKYSARMPAPALSLVEKLLEWDPRKRMTAANALSSRYFWTQPVVPENLAELGEIQVGPGGHFHEFQTKKKRKEAKALADEAKKEAKLKGATSEEAQEEFDRVYRALMKKVAEEGVGDTAKPDPPVTQLSAVVAAIPPPKNGDRRASNEHAEAAQPSSTQQQNESRPSTEDQRRHEERRDDRRRHSDDRHRSRSRRDDDRRSHREDRRREDSRSSRHDREGHRERDESRRDRDSSRRERDESRRERQVEDGEGGAHRDDRKRHREDRHREDRHEDERHRKKKHKKKDRDERHDRDRSHRREHREMGIPDDHRRFHDHNGPGPREPIYNDLNGPGPGPDHRRHHDHNGPGPREPMYNDHNGPGPGPRGPIPNWTGPPGRDEPRHRFPDDRPRGPEPPRRSDDHPMDRYGHPMGHHRPNDNRRHDRSHGHYGPTS